MSTLWAMVTLDLKGEITKEQREKFYEILRGNHWTKISGLTTTWRFSVDNSTVEKVEKLTERRIKEASKKSAVDKYKVAVMIAPKKEHTFT